MKKNELYTLGIDIGSTTVKVAVLNEKHELLFSDYERHFADIQNTLANLLDNLGFRHDKVCYNFF